MQTLDRSQRRPYTNWEYARRFLWAAVQASLFRFSLPQMTTWRRFLLGLFGAKIGHSVIHPTVKIMHPWLLSMGDWSNLGPRVVVYNLGPIHIGSHTLVSQHVYLCAGTHDYHEPSLPLLRPSISIGSGVWIAAHAFIGPGIHIGDGSVIGARSVVARNVPPGVVAAGNPCRVLKPRVMSSVSGSSTRLNILHLTVGTQGGGLPRYLLDLCNGLHEMGHHVTVAGDVGPMQPLFDAAPFPYIKIPLAGGPISFLRCADALRNETPDLIHSHYRRATLLGRRLQRQKSPPILYSVHLSHLSLNWWRRPLTDFGDHTHVAAEEARQWVIEEGRMPADHVSYVAHGIDVHKFPLRTQPQRAAARAALNLQPDACVASFVGRFDYPKNEDWLLDVATAMPELHVLLVGGGPNESSLRDRVARLGLQRRVFVLGNRDPLQIYQASDALLLPSLREGFGLACGEAMSVGVPVLRTRTSGSALQIVEGVTGRTTDIDRQAFVTAAVDFLSDRHALARMGNAAAKHVRECFPFEKQLTETLDLYRRLITLSRQDRGPMHTEATRL
jgi:putative colanic acid biosynthesis acetyltransferase WcaF